MPQSSFVDSIIQMSNGSTEEIHDLKDSLVRAAQERPDCPRGTWNSRRKSNQEAIDNFQRRFALDCYKLMYYIEGGSNAEITGFLRLAEPNTSELVLALRNQGPADDASGCPHQPERTPERRPGFFTSADTPGY